MIVNAARGPRPGAALPWPRADLCRGQVRSRIAAFERVVLFFGKVEHRNPVFL